MKKILYILSIIFLLIIFINMKNNQTIQDDSIRFRIIANSNSAADQNIKLKVRDSILNEMGAELSSYKNASEAKTNISKKN